MYKQESIRALFPETMFYYFKNIIRDYEKIKEIRIRRNGPLCVLKGNQSLYLTAQGEYAETAGQGVCLSEKEFFDLFNHICRHSVYAFEEELCKGYITVEGGHRIGVVGQTVWNGKEIKSIKYFTALNIRISHEIKGVADKILPHLYTEEGLKSTLIVSPPGCGKTTLLRDLVRKVSNGSKAYPPQNISLIDERSEIASCYLGLAQNDVGMHTDILDACPKATGMLMALRTMSPDVIAVDELGGEEDYRAMQQAFYLGCRIFATLHGNDFSSLRANPYRDVMLGAGGFERIIFFHGKAGDGQKTEICNRNGECILWC